MHAGPHSGLNRLFTDLWIFGEVTFLGIPLLLLPPILLAAVALGAWAGPRVSQLTRRMTPRLRRRLRRLTAGLPARVRPAADAGDGLADDLDHAIDRDEFFLAHQPKMRGRSGTIDAVETLVRWQHPVRGLIAPNDFIGLAEEHGQIRRLTEWVIRRAIVEQRELAAAGHALAFNVNISARLLADRGFADWALATVRDASGPIGFEITETAMIADPEGALRNIHLFVDAGIKIAIDDYGAGLSSLAYLKQLPATELKIDRLFISGLSSSHRDPLLVRSTIDLAHALDMEVTAEGVDSPAALALLKVMGCDIIQGFLIAKPMPLPALLTFLDARARGASEKFSLGFNWLKQGAER